MFGVTGFAEDLVNNGGVGGIAPVEMRGLPLINHTLAELKQRAVSLGITTPVVGTCAHFVVK
jgi:hypothetical protein